MWSEVLMVLIAALLAAGGYVLKKEHQKFLEPYTRFGPDLEDDFRSLISTISPKDLDHLVIKTRGSTRFVRRGLRIKLFHGLLLVVKINSGNLTRKILLETVQEAVRRTLRKTEYFPIFYCFKQSLVLRLKNWIKGRKKR